MVLDNFSYEARVSFSTRRLDDSGADSRIEPERSPSGLPRVPDCYDLLRIGDGLALSLGAFGPGCGLGGGTLAVLRSAVGPIVEGYSEHDHVASVGIYTLLNCGYHLRMAGTTRRFHDVRL